jgi:hypothetical protein
MLTTCDSVHKYNTRSCTNFVIDNVRTNYGKRNLNFEGMRLYNNLSSELKKIPNEKTFRLHLRRHILGVDAQDNNSG